MVLLLRPVLCGGILVFDGVDSGPPGVSGLVAVMMRVVRTATTILTDKGVV